MMPEASALESRPRLVTFGPFSFDPQNRLLSRNGAEIPLPPRVLGVLELLISRPGEVVPRQELLDRVWKDAFVTDTSLAEAISFLRQALGDDPQAPRYVQTVHRRGYRFLPALTPASSYIGGGEPTSAPIKPSIAGDLAPWSVAAVCAVLAIAAVWQVASRPAQEPSPIVRFDVRPAAGSIFDRRAPALAVSPDGRTIAWSACGTTTTICALYVRQLDRLDPLPVRGTDGALAPFFSPDARWIGFFADGKLKKIAASGGSATTLADAPVAGGASWGADGRIVFSGTPAGGLAIVSDQGGDVKQLTRPRPDRGEVRHIWPSWLPDQRAVVFTIAGSPLPGAPGELVLLPLTSSSWRVLRSGVTRGVLTGTGYLLASTGTELQAQTFDERTLTLTGAADTVLDGLATAAGNAQFTVNNSGTLVAVTAPGSRRQMAWADEPDRTLSGLARLGGISISPDGRRAAGVSIDAAGSDIWVVDLDRGGASRVTYGGINVAPVWTPDGQLLFAPRTTGPFVIAKSAANAGAGVQTLLKDDAHLFPGSAAVDGRIAIVKSLPDGRLSIGVSPRAGADPVLYNDGPFDQAMPAFSPDAAWLAFASDESGRWEIYVRSLRDGRRFAISTEGGERPSWSSDGRWIYFHDASRLLRASFTGGTEPSGAKPEVVFDRPDARVAAVAPGGRLLIERQPPSQESATVVLQWLREVRQKLPVPVTAPR